MPSLFHAFNFRTAKRRGLAPTLLLVSLHPLIYRRDYILIHDAFFCASLTDILLTFRGRPEMRHTLFIVPLL